MRTFNFLLLILSLITFSCSSDDSEPPCTPLNCQNNGVSTIDCECDCPENYTGETCNQQVQPNSVSITKFTVKLFPPSDLDGNLWDSFLTGNDSYPDIYLIFYNSEQIIYESPSYYINVSSPVTELDFVPEQSIEISNVNQFYSIAIFDYDDSIFDSEDDFMDFVETKLYNNTNGFPESITIISESDEFIVEVFLDYNY